jgi:hypothetical protein
MHQTTLEGMGLKWGISGCQVGPANLTTMPPSPLWDSSTPFWSIPLPPLRMHLRRT